ncbi:hypothetical protein BaRGS_00010475 [Batillaria attramentaria]|uniref:Uncharacterized protein n=1 Tax=Batillaria attramentaria TaxID=370345 RepID=A0ABD0LFK9_9CAEN
MYTYAYQLAPGGGGGADTVSYDVSDPTLTERNRHSMIGACLVVGFSRGYMISTIPLTAASVLWVETVQVSAGRVRYSTSPQLVRYLSAWCVLYLVDITRQPCLGCM